MVSRAGKAPVAAAMAALSLVTVGQAAVTDDLISYTPLDSGTVSGATVNELVADRDGTINDTSAVTVTTGQIGQALSFNNGRVDFVEEDAIDPGTGSYSVSLWFNSSSVASPQFLASKSNSAASNVPGWQVWIRTAAGVDPHLQVRAGVDNNNRVGQTYYGIQANTWYNVVMVIDRDPTSATAKTTIRGYLNGSNVGWLPGNVAGVSSDADADQFDINSTAGLRLGLSSAGTFPFAGALDDVAIWNRALSQAEIQTLFSEGSAGRTPLPEPAASAILGVGGLLAMRRRR